MSKNNADQIHKQLALIMEEVGAIGKDKENQTQGFKYRGIDQIVDMLHPIMAKHKVFVMPEVLSESTEERKTSRGGNLIYRVLKVRIDYVSGIDGSVQSSVVIGEGMDSGDKASNKAMTAALKYAFSQTFVLPYGLVDGDATTPEQSTPKAESVQQDSSDKGGQPKSNLIEKMANDGVSNRSMIQYCEAKGWLEPGQKLMALGDKLIEAMLKPENWAKVVAATKQEEPAGKPKDKPDDKPKDKPAPAADDKEKLVGTQQDAFHAGLYKLMELSGVGREELKKYLLGKKYITENQTIDNLPEKFVDAMTEDANWNKVVDAIKKARVK